MKIAMPPQETEELKKIIDTSSNILEYGSGGSTIYAALSDADNIISVENDREFLDKVILEYEAIELFKPNLFPIHSYIGPTKMWGYPIDDSHKHLWKNYPVSGWNIAREYSIDPDTIIIDGRFRVACFLYSIGHCKKDAVIFWDDYVNRESYHVIEKICKPRHIYGRAAVFIKNDEVFDQEMFDKYCNDMR